MSEPGTSTSTVGKAPTPANRLGLDYRQQSRTFPRRPTPIIDCHTHVVGAKAAAIHKQAADDYGIGMIYSMTPLPWVEQVRETMGDRIRFIAVPNWRAEDKRLEFGRNFISTIETFYHQHSSRIVKFWAAPRSRDVAEEELGDRDFLQLNSPAKLDAMEAASQLGMIFMSHVADPDTWFQTKYADASKYGTKLQQYEPLEEALERFAQPWILAHMGGWPEDLEFLDALLTRHPNIYLDTSACKWMVRELSRHSRDDLLAFLQKFHGRIIFGSDIVSTDEHLQSSADQNDQFARANSPEDAYDLYASRYWALRTLFERDYDGESPIADPDLAMIAPEQYDEMSAPRLVGKSLPEKLLQMIYHDAAARLLDPLHR